LLPLYYTQKSGEDGGLINGLEGSRTPFLYIFNDNIVHTFSQVHDGNFYLFIQASG